MSGQGSGRFSIIPARAVDDARLGAAAFRVLAALGTYSDKQGWCWASYATLGKRVGTSRGAVIRQIGLLVELGYLELYAQTRRDGSRTANRYRVLYDRFDDPSTGSGQAPGVGGRPGAEREAPEGVVTSGNQVVTSGDHPDSPGGVGGDSPGRVGGDSPDESPILERPKERPQERVTRAHLAAFKAAYPATPYWGDAAVERALAAALAAGADFGELVAGAARYAAALPGDARQLPACSPVRWLEERRWTALAPAGAAARAAVRPRVTNGCPAEGRAWWAGVHARLRARKGAAWCDSWLKDLVYDGARVCAPTRFLRDQLAADLAPELGGVPLLHAPETCKLAVEVSDAVQSP